MVRKMRVSMVKQNSALKMFLPFNFYQLLDFLLKKGERDLIIERIFKDTNYHHTAHDIELFRKLFHINEIRLESKLNLD